jgi:hypothetical protein
MDTCVFASRCATHRAVLVGVWLQQPIIGLMEEKPGKRPKIEEIRMLRIDLWLKQSVEKEQWTRAFLRLNATHRAVLVVRVRLQRPVVGLTEEDVKGRLTC